MTRITLRITLNWRVGGLAIGLALGLLLFGLVIALERPVAAYDEAAPTYFGWKHGRYFYLTNTSYATNEVKTACATGYHMASLWEILDVSNLIYDYDHPAAHVKGDSGKGPPSYWYGWIRTGQDSSGSSTAGTGNCLNWTSTDSGVYGVAVRLSRTWETDPGDIFTWDATAFNCGSYGPVWCVGDFYTVYLPLILEGYP